MKIEVFRCQIDPSLSSHDFWIFYNDGTSTRLRNDGQEMAEGFWELRDGNVYINDLAREENDFDLSWWQARNSIQEARRNKVERCVAEIIVT